MDETIRAIVDSVTVRYDKPTSIRGGHQVTTYYDCARLVPSDLARLAAHATGDLTEDDFDAVLGIAYSGIFFASAVAGGRQVNILQKDGALYGAPLKGKKVLIVDDVIVSGAHLELGRKVVTEHGGQVVGYACIVDRSKGTIAGKLPILSAIQDGV